MTEGKRFATQNTLMTDITKTYDFRPLAFSFAKKRIDRELHRTPMPKTQNTPQPKNK